MKKVKIEKVNRRKAEKNKVSIWLKVLPLFLLGGFITMVNQHAINDNKERMNALVATLEEATGHNVEWVECKKPDCDAKEKLIITYPTWEQGKQIEMKIYPFQHDAYEYYNIYGFEPEKHGITNYFIDKIYVITSDEKVSYDEFSIVTKGLEKHLPHQY